MHVRELPSLRLYVDAVTPIGRHYRWGPDEPRADNVPDGLRFSDTMPGGFESMDATLPRKPGVGYADLDRLSTLRVLGPGGAVAGEYRLERAPRVSGDQMAVAPSAVGWQAHLDDDKSAREVYVDRDITRWGEASLARRAFIASFGNSQGQVSMQAVPGGLTWDIPNEAMPTGVTSEAHYDIGPGLLTERFDYIGARTGAFTTFEAPLLYGAATDDFASPGTTALTLDNLGHVVTGIGLRYLMLRVRTTGAVTPAAGHQQRYTLLVVIGNHGATLSTAADGIVGIRASDVIRNAVPGWAPLLNITAESVQSSAFVIPHLAFHELTTVAEIVRQVTRFGLQDWAVWDNKTFYWHERGAFGRNWRARIAPSQLEETGPQVDRLWESIVVQYQDVDGTTRTVGPPGSGANTEDAVLKDDDPENPANELGIIRRDLLVMGISTAAGAIEVGRRFLEQTKLLDSSGRARIIGHVMDDHGVMHPYWRVRAGDTINFIDAADTSARRIVRTEKSTADRSCAIDLDAPPDAMAALLERLGVVLVPLGL